MSIRRARWLLRVGFHDWMWDQSPNRVLPRLRRLAQALPLYFSDPYYISDKEYARILSAHTLGGNATVGTTVVFNVASTSDLIRFQEF